MEKSSYGQRDYAFGQTMLTLRTSIGLTQAQLAEDLGISRNAVGDWETGNRYPSTSHLKDFIVLCVQASAFAAGHEAEEIRALWKAARQKVRLDDSWLSTLLSPQRPSERLQEHDPVAGGARVDWGEALAVPTFYGREGELTTLCRWVLQEHCRVVSVLGMGGIGKSALVTSAMYQLASHFQVVIFRSLRDAPEYSAWLEDCLQMLAPEQVASGQESQQRNLSLLLEHLRSTRVLLVLDNLEALLSQGDVRGRLRPGLEGYGDLLRQVAQTAHQSCLLLTSREKPADLRRLEVSQTPVRTLRLAGLDAVSCEQLLADHEVVGSHQERTSLIEAYAGNPLALKIVAETIADLFGGEIAPFLVEGTVVFGDLAELLAEQVGRLSALEQTLLCWLAIVREPLILQELLALLVGSPSRGQVLEALDSLRCRCLIEPGHRPGSFTLHSVVLEYVTTDLVERAGGEILLGQLSRLLQHGLCLAQAKDYVRQSQQRLLLSPLLARLQRTYQRPADVEKQLCSLLDQVRHWTEESQGYGPANLVTLLALLQGNLRSLDLSHLAIRGAYLQGVEMQDANLSGALLRECLLTQSFDAITAVAISKSGQYWAAAGRRGEARVWREEGQMLHLVWQAHTDIMVALAFSPDGRTLATASHDSSLKLWDVESGALLWSGWQTKAIDCLAFAPNGNLLACGGHEATIQLWDAKLGTPLEDVPHPGPIFSLAWSPDGRLLASGDGAGTIRLWERQRNGSARCVQTLSEHSGWVRGLAFAPDGRSLASASFDRTVKLWEVSSGRCLETLRKHTDKVYCVAWSPDGGTLASGGDHTIWLWDAHSRSSRAVLHSHTSLVRGLAFTPDSRSLLSGSEDDTLRLWDVLRGELLRIQQGYAPSLSDVDWSPDGTRLASGGTDSLLTIWGVERSAPLRVLQGHRRVVYAVAWSPDGRLVASSGWDDAVRVWDTCTGEPGQPLRDPDRVDTYFWGLAWSPDGKLLACAAPFSGVLLWDMRVRSGHWIGRDLALLIRRLAFSPDGTRLVGGAEDGHVYVWDASDGRLLKRMPGHHGAVMSVAWSPDGSRLASVGGGSRNSGELFVWDAHSGERMYALQGLAGVVSTVAWHPIEDLLISGGSDGQLRWWEIPSLQCVRVREAHQGTVQSLRVSPDGSLLATCGDDGAITIWNLHSGQHMRTLRRDRPYERLNITGIRGLTEAQKATLRALGAREESAPSL